GDEVARHRRHVEPEQAGLLDVAEVGEDAQSVRLDEQRGVRAVQLGEGPDVDRVGDEQRRLDQGADTVETRPHRALTDEARNSRASRYPSGPFPITRFAAKSAIRDTRRHSSRSSTFERCTSTTGTAKSSTASRIA